MTELKYQNYLFFDVDKSFYSLSAEERETEKSEFLDYLKQWENIDKKMKLEHSSLVTYSTLGHKKGTTFMIWIRSNIPGSLKYILTDINRLQIGKRLILTYSFFGITRNSQYSGRTGKNEQDMMNFSDRLTYFVLYPFTKTHEWYQLPAEKRKELMSEHIKVGLNYPKIRQNLLYSYGVDDYEFLVSYEMDTLEEFQDLIIEMRKTKGRIYTQSDTPIFTCTYLAITDLMDIL